MTDNLKHLIEVYGTDSARWPVHFRSEAEAALQANPDSAKNAAALDNALDGHTIAAPSELLRARILKAAKADVKSVSATDVLASNTSSHSRKILRFAAVAAALMICAVLGYQTLSPVSVEDTTQWVEAANDLGIEDLYAWVEGET